MEEAYGTTWKQLFTDSTFKEMELWGEWRGLPTGSCGNSVMLYNQDIFDQFNLKVPETYDELKDVSKVLNDNGIIPIAVGGKTKWPAVYLFTSVCVDTGGESIFKADAMETTWDAPWLVEAFRIWREMVTEKILVPGYTQVDLVEADTMGFTGKAAMSFCGTWATFHFTLDPYKGMISGRKILATRWPDFNGDGKQPPTWGGPDLITVFSKDAPSPENAFKVLRWAAIEDGAETFFESLLTMPSVQTYELDWEKVIKKFEPANIEDLKNIYSYFQDEMSCMVGRRGELNQFTRQLLIEFTEKVAIGDVTPEEAAKQLNAQFRELNGLD